MTAAATVPDPEDLLEAQRQVFLDPDDPNVQTTARAAGIAEDWIEAARRSHDYQLAMTATDTEEVYRLLAIAKYDER